MVNFQIWTVLCCAVVLAGAGGDHVTSQAKEDTEPQANSLPDILYSHDKYHDHKPFIYKPKPKPVHHISIPIPHLPLPDFSHLFKPVSYHKPGHHTHEYGSHHNHEYGPHHTHEYGPHHTHEYATTTCHCPPPPQCHHEHHTTQRPHSTHRTTTPTPTPTPTTRTTRHTTEKQPSHHHDSTMKPEQLHHHTGSSGAFPRDTSLTTFIRQLFWPFNPYQQGSESVHQNLQFYDKSEKEYSSEDEEGNSIAAARNLESQDPVEEARLVTA